MSSGRRRAEKRREKRYNGTLLREDIALKRLGEDCAPAMYRWMCDPEVAGNIGLTREPSLESTLAWIELQRTDASIEAFGILAGDEHIGNVVLDQIDRYHGKARFSIYLGEAPTRARGAGTTAGYLALEWGFRELGLEKIWLTVHERNEIAIRSYERLGFVREGLLRGEFLLDGERLPLVYMGILRDEFLRLAGEKEPGG
jgi:RimJ/RimL family protein N-acetyltransferase